MPCPVRPRRYEAEAIVKLLEYRGKEPLRRAGIALPPGTLVTTAADAELFVRDNPGSWVRKSQVLIGGRHKAGGIKFVDAADDARTTSDALLQLVIRNEQNPDGERVTSLLVERKLSIEIDRKAKRPVVIVTAAGGMDVEEVAKHHPHAIAKRGSIPTSASHRSSRDSSRFVRICRPVFIRVSHRSSQRCTVCS
jgi:succinyl-CoA synthetase beta subunit